MIRGNPDSERARSYTVSLNHFITRICVRRIIYGIVNKFDVTGSVAGLRDRRPTYNYLDFSFLLGFNVINTGITTLTSEIIIRQIASYRDDSWIM